MKSVYKLDDNHADILCHCKEHLTQVIDLLLLSCIILNLLKLCHTAYKQSHVCAKESFDIFV